MNESSLEILEQLTRQSGRGKRLKQLLTDPNTNQGEKWFMAVPSCFNDALDIKWNYGQSNPGWTQGRCFGFKATDTLYDTPYAYDVWSEAINHINLAVHIEAATSASQGKEGTRFRGSITLSFHTPDAARKKMIKRGSHSMTQDQFIRFLIAGPDVEFKGKIEEAQLSPDSSAHPQRVSPPGQCARLLGMIPESL